MSEAAIAPTGQAQAAACAAVEEIGFWDYTSEFYVPNMMPKLPLKSAHEEICDALERAVIGALGYQFLWILMPPRTGKTTLSNALGTWTEGSFDGPQIITTSYAQEQAKLAIAQMQNAMHADWYVDLFTDLLHGEKDDHLSTTNGGNIFAEGVGGQLLGKGAGGKEPCGGYFLIDDPTKPQETLSPTIAKNIHTWLEITALNRRNSDKWCPVIGIAQKLGPLDLVEYFKTNYKNETLILKFPGFVDRKSRFPETYSDDRISIAERTRLGRFVFATQIQQDSVVLGGNMIPVDKFLRYSKGPADRNLTWDDKIIVCDTALKKGEGNDWWVLQCWGRLGRKVYLIDQARYQCNTAEFCRYAVAFYQKHMAAQENHPVSTFIIEDSAAGPGVISALNEGGIPATPIVPIKDKVARVNDVLAYIETGCAYIPSDDDPESSEWLPTFLSELAAFSQDMTHEHDDQVDCVAYALNELLGGGLSILQVLGIGPAFIPGVGG